MFLIDDLLLIGGAALLGGAIGSAAGGVTGALIAIAIDIFLDEDSISNEVKVRYPEALKLMIQEKKSTAVKVGIYDEDDEKIETGVEISSSQGVSDNLYVGQEIYL